METAIHNGVGESTDLEIVYIESFSRSPGHGSGLKSQKSLEKSLTKKFPYRDENFSSVKKFQPKTMSDHKNVL